MALAEKQPDVYRKDAKYRAGTLSVETDMMKPAMAMNMGMAICKPRSLERSLESATREETMEPMR